MITLIAVLFYHKTESFGKEEPSPDGGDNPLSHCLFALGRFVRDRQKNSSFFILLGLGLLKHHVLLSITLAACLI
jgi:hypothetical protein